MATGKTKWARRLSERVAEVADSNGFSPIEFWQGLSERKQNQLMDAARNGWPFMLRVRKTRPVQLGIVKIAPFA